jgi:hypothetical protein
LDESYRLPDLTELEGRAAWAEVRSAWSEQGLAFCVIAKIKDQEPDRRMMKIEGRDGLHVWIDTRDVRNVHRAGRFCHRFAFLVEGTGQGNLRGATVHVRRGTEEVVEQASSSSGHLPRQLPPSPSTAGKKSAAFVPVHAEAVTIHRAKELPQPVRQGLLQARCRTTADGYILEALIPAEALTGFDTVEHPRLGFTYAVVDRRLGEQTFCIGGPMPYQEDPSLWATLELTK